ncbi:MAG: hypothetical protein IJ880_17315 [Bacilli bacterium]|nr:hypothetical protein [Bacilli bacterium]
MNLGKSKKANINYLAKIVNIKEFSPHPKPSVERLKCATVDGFTILVGINSEPGLYVYFPAGCKINPQFLSYNNLFRHGELNANPEETGMFDDNGRVKAIKLQDVISEGFLLPAVMLSNFITSVTNKEITIEDNTEFDAVLDGDKEFWINKKYVAKESSQVTRSGSSSKKKVSEDINKVRDDQFRFHYDTIIIKKCPYVITPDAWIHISSKVHGTSGISAYVLCHKKLSWKEKIAKWLTKWPFDIYDYLYASRTVIKNPSYNPNVTPGYYGFDIWEEADKIVRPRLTKGMTAYYEILGYLPEGQYIQKGYDYGYVPDVSESQPYQYGRNFGIRIYRLTYTNVDGQVHEFSPREVQIWSKEHELIPVTELYYGRAKDLYPDLDPDVHFSENFVDRLSNDTNFYMECDSPDCANKVPHEGVVIKIDNMKSAAFKLKCFKFLNKEQQALDKGESNIEDEA